LLIEADPSNVETGVFVGEDCDWELDREVDGELDGTLDGEFDGLGETAPY
jgi:hypothetical protein